MNADKLTFGVEIECYVPWGKITSIGAYKHGIQVPDMAHGWTAERDGSLLEGTPSGFTAVEIVSPVLKGEFGLNQIYHTLQVLAEFGAVVNKSCGLHVHVGKPGRYNDAEVSRIIQSFFTVESAFFSLCGSSIRNRVASSYCKPSPLWGSNPYYDRYQSLNLTNLAKRKGTVEFRMFEGSLDYRQVLTAVYMCLGFVSAALDGSLSEYKAYGQNSPEGTGSAHRVTYRFIRNTFSRRAHLVIQDESFADVMAYMIEQAAAADQAQARGGRRG